MGLIDDLAEAALSTHDVTKDAGGLKQFGYKIFSVVYILGMIYGCALLAIANLPEIDIAGWIGGFIGLIIGILSASLAYKIMKFILVVGIICGAIYVIYSVI
jgi:hypothetical protein